MNLQGRLPAVGGEAAADISRAQLRRACQEFEGVFLGLLMREMQATVQPGGLLPRGTAGEIFHSLWCQELTNVGAARAPLRIADILMKSLEPAAICGHHPRTQVERAVDRIEKGERGQAAGGGKGGGGSNENH